MNNFEPVRGDNVPFSVTVRYDGNLYDLTSTTSVTFSFLFIDANTTKSLSGVINDDPNATDEEKATAWFYPDTTFWESAGLAKGDLQVVNDGITFTPLRGFEFQILDDVTK